MTKAWRFVDIQFRRTRISVEGASKDIKSFKPTKYRKEIITFWFVSAVSSFFFFFHLWLKIY